MGGTQRAVLLLGPAVTTEMVVCEMTENTKDFAVLCAVSCAGFAGGNGKTA